MPQSRRWKKSAANEQRLVDEFNAYHPVGTPVRYWTGVREGEGKTGKTRSEAELLSGHTAVVWIEGCVGCVALSHVEVMEEQESPL